MIQLKNESKIKCHFELLDADMAIYLISLVAGNSNAFSAEQQSIAKLM